MKIRYDVFGSSELGGAHFAGKYEFPIIPGLKTPVSIGRVVPFDRVSSITSGDWIHFYVHDNRFHRFLSRKDHYLRYLEKASGFIGIDNSLYRDLPLAEQIHSCYLNRAIDYCLCRTGRSVIPNVSWGDWRSFEFCFDGLPRQSIVAVSTYGCCRSRVDRAYFEDGFSAMIERINPSSVLLHGAMWQELYELIDYANIRLKRMATHRESVNGGKEVCHG